MQNIVKTEELVLRCLLKEPALVTDYGDYFLSDSAKSLCRRFKTLYIQNMEATDQHILSVDDQVPIDPSMLKGLRLVDFDIKKIDNYYENLRTFYAKNYLNRSIKYLDIETSKRDTYDPEKVESLIKDIGNFNSILKGGENKLFTTKMLFEDYGDELVRRQHAPVFYDTGCYHLNSILTVGFDPGYMSLFFASSSMGKSAYVLYLINQQIIKNIPSLYVSLENDKMMTMDRLVANRLNINLAKLYEHGDNGYDSSILDRFEVEKKKMESMPNRFMFLEETSLSIVSLEMNIEKVKEKLKTDYMIVTVDLLSQLTEFGVNITAQSIESAANQLHAMAKRQGVHIAGVWQANQDMEKSPPKDCFDWLKFRPSITNIKNSSAIRERFRQVFGMIRPKNIMQRFFPDDPQVEAHEDILYVSNLKQTQGSLGQLQYIADMPKFKFTPLLDTDRLDN